MRLEMSAESVDGDSSGTAVVGLARARKGLDTSGEQFRLLVESVEDYAIFMPDRAGCGGLEPGGGEDEGLPRRRDHRTSFLVVLPA